MFYRIKQKFYIQIQIMFTFHLNTFQSISELFGFIVCFWQVALMIVIHSDAGTILKIFGDAFRSTPTTVEFMSYAMLSEY